MYTENLKKDIILFFKAFLTNQIAKFAPKFYVNQTKQTGRGENEGEPSDIARYFIQCFYDYQLQLGLDETTIEPYLKDKVILEYGPGDILGVALLFYAHGAQTVHCVDRFPLSKMSPKNVDIYLHLFKMLDGKQRERAENIFKEKGNPMSGFNEDAVRYNVTKDGLSGVDNQYDLIISRAVLEHVNDLNQTMLDIKRSMKANGVSLHKVDLKSHKLDRYVDLDFLTWPTLLYNLMYSHKGFPNRWRVNKYRELAENLDFNITKLIPVEQLDQEKINIIYPELAKEFRQLSPEELSWLSFWIQLEKKS